MNKWMWVVIYKQPRIGSPSETVESGRNFKRPQGLFLCEFLKIMDRLVKDVVKFIYVIT